MQLKLKAGGMIGFLNLHLIINGNLVIPLASLMIMQLSLIIILTQDIILDIQMLGSAVLVHMAKDLLKTQLVIANDKIITI